MGWYWGQKRLKVISNTRLPFEIFLKCRDLKAELQNVYHACYSLEL